MSSMTEAIRDQAEGGMTIIRVAGVVIHLEGATRVGVITIIRGAEAATMGTKTVEGMMVAGEGAMMAAGEGAMTVEAGDQAVEADTLGDVSI